MQVTKTTLRDSYCNNCSSQGYEPSDARTYKDMQYFDIRIGPSQHSKTRTTLCETCMQRLVRGYEALKGE